MFLRHLIMKKVVQQMQEQKIAGLEQEKKV
jgi:hypothetical protein